MSQAQSFTPDNAARIAATPELLRRNLNPAVYRATVEVEDELVVVIFTDSDVPPGSRGVPAVHPAIEVELDARTLKIIRSYFVR